MDNLELYNIANRAKEYSYSPFSKVKVGAALLCKDGEIFTGCNVENASFAATICAERTAIVKAVSEGKKEFLKIAISSNKRGITPCGLCRQTLIEFSPNISIIYLDENDIIIEKKIGELIPFGFTLKA